MINYQFFPRSHGVTTEIKAIIDCFKQIEPQLEEENVQRTSNEVLALVRPHLEAIGFAVETGKGKEEKIDVPVLCIRGANELKGKRSQPAELKYTKDGRFVVIEDCGHMLNMERPNEFNRSILEFIKSQKY